MNTGIWSTKKAGLVNISSNCIFRMAQFPIRQTLELGNIIGTAGKSIPN